MLVFPEKFSVVSHSVHCVFFPFVASVSVVFFFLSPSDCLSCSTGAAVARVGMGEEQLSYFLMHRLTHHAEFCHGQGRGCSCEHVCCLRRSFMWPASTHPFGSAEGLKRRSLCRRLRVLILSFLLFLLRRHLRWAAAAVLPSFHVFCSLCSLRNLLQLPRALLHIVTFITRGFGTITGLQFDRHTKRLHLYLSVRRKTFLLFPYTFARVTSPASFLFLLLCVYTLVLNPSNDVSTKCFELYINRRFLTHLLCTSTKCSS